MVHCNLFRNLLNPASERTVSAIAKKVPVTIHREVLELVERSVFDVPIAEKGLLTTGGLIRVYHRTSKMEFTRSKVRKTPSVALAHDGVVNQN